MLLADLQSSGALPADWEAAQPQVCPWRQASAGVGGSRLPVQGCAVSDSDAVRRRRRAWCAG